MDFVCTNHVFSVLGFIVLKGEGSQQVNTSVREIRAGTGLSIFYVRQSIRILTKKNILTPVGSTSRKTIFTLTRNA